MKELDEQNDGRRSKKAVKFADAADGQELTRTSEKYPLCRRRRRGGVAGGAATAPRRRRGGAAAPRREKNAKNGVKIMQSDLKTTENV